MAEIEQKMVEDVVEASLDKGRGPIATLLIQQGTLKRGDMILAALTDVGADIKQIRSSLASLDLQGYQQFV